MEMNKETFDAIKDLTRKADKTVTGADGKEYSFDKLHRVFDDPRPAGLQVLSLDGIVDYLENNVDKYEKKDLMLHVVDYDRVDLITNIHGERKERHIVLSASLDGDKFKFESFIPQELFIIKVKSLFQDTDDKALILHRTAKIDTESAIKTTDDGVTQQIQVKKGISGAMVSTENMKSIVKMKPFRTFREIDQPESEFLFRMKDSGGVHCALFEADGGSWKIEARKRIAEYLKKTEVAIIA